MHRMTERSTMFRSSRGLPGHGYCLHTSRVRPVDLVNPLGHLFRKSLHEILVRERWPHA
jgi:hypothetical protein